MAGRSLTDETIDTIRRRFVAGENKSAIADDMGIDRVTVVKYTKGIDPKKEQAKHLDKVPTGWPAAMEQTFKPYVIDTSGRWLDMSDIHIPFHVPKLIDSACSLAAREKIVGVVLNGDILDCQELSDFDREPDAMRFVQEIELGRQFIVELRRRFKHARIVWKEGNHEERMRRYIVKRAPALFGIAALSIPELLGFHNLGIEWVDQKRIIKMGHLSVVHGHEFKSGISAPVNPARGYFLKAKECVIGGHHHQTSEHHEPTLSGKPQAAWSQGCMCGLNPAYMPVNKWNHGYAMIELDGQEFEVRNLRG